MGRGLAFCWVSALFFLQSGQNDHSGVYFAVRLSDTLPCWVWVTDNKLLRVKTMSNATVELTIDDECTVFADGQAVEFVGWAGPDTTGREDDAYHVADFFGPDGKYRGPDQHGTYPVFAIA